MTFSEDKVKEQYDHVAPVYDKRWKSYVGSSLLFLKSWMHVTGDEKILDVACGTGALEELIARQNPSQKMTGIDVSGNMLNIAKGKLGRYSNVALFEARANELPFSDSMFDVVVCANSFHYLDDPLSCVLQMKRVLKTGGRLIILDWCRDYLICQLCDLFLKFFDSAYKHCYRQRELNRFLRDAKLRVFAEHKFRLSFIWGMMIAEAIK